MSSEEREMRMRNLSLRSIIATCQAHDLWVAYSPVTSQQGIALYPHYVASTSDGLRPVVETGVSSITLHCMHNTPFAYYVDTVTLYMYHIAHAG